MLVVEFEEVVPVLAVVFASCCASFGEGVVGRVEVDAWFLWNAASYSIS